MSVDEEMAALVERARAEGDAAGYARARAELAAGVSDAASARMAADVLNVIAGSLSPAFGAVVREHAESLRNGVEIPTAKLRATKSEVQIEWSHPMDGIDLPQNVTVAPATGGPALHVGATYDFQTQILSLRTAKGFSKGVEYRVTVPGHVRSLSGVPLGEDVELTFTGK